MARRQRGRNCTTQGVASNTILVMAEKNVNLNQHVPQRYEPLEAAACDIVVNMSGFKLPGPPPKELIEWRIPDPYGDTIEVFRMVRDELRTAAMRLILELRKEAKRANQNSRPQ